MKQTLCEMLSIIFFLVAFEFLVASSTKTYYYFQTTMDGMTYCGTTDFPYGDSQNYRLSITNVCHWDSAVSLLSEFNSKLKTSKPEDFQDSALYDAIQVDGNITKRKMIWIPIEICGIGSGNKPTLSFKFTISELVEAKIVWENGIEEQTRANVYTRRSSTGNWYQNSPDQWSGELRVLLETKFEENIWTLHQSNYKIYVNKDNLWRELEIKRELLGRNNAIVATLKSHDAS